MKYFFYIFAGFWVLWILWYLGGGPMRDDKSKAFISPTENGFAYSSTTPSASVNDLQNAYQNLKK